MFLRYNFISLQDHVRDIKWKIEDVKEFVEKRRNKPIKAVIDSVRDGSTVRAFLLPDFHNATIMIHGIRVSVNFLPFHLFLMC